MLSEQMLFTHSPILCKTDLLFINSGLALFQKRNFGHIALLIFFNLYAGF